MQGMHMGHQMQPQQQQQQIILVTTARGQMTLQEAIAFGLPYNIIGQVPSQQPQQQMYLQQGQFQPQPNPYIQNNGSQGGVFSGSGHQPSPHGTDSFEEQRYAQANQSFEKQYRRPEPPPDADFHYRQPPTTTPVETKAAETNELLIIKGSEMDRAKHELVYFGETYKEDLDLRMTHQAKTADVLARSSIHDPGENSISAEYVFEPSLQVAIATGEKKRLEIRQQTSVDAMYRNFVSLITPLTAAPDTAPFMKNICGAKDFNGIALTIRTISAALQKEKEKGNAEHLDGIEDSFNMLTALDVKLTTMVNLFLRISLNLDTFIDGFTDDIADLAGFLKKKGNLDRALSEYEMEVMHVLNEVPDEKTREEINQFYGFDKSHDAALFMEKISITHMVLNSRQLGWKVKSTPQIVNKTTAPSLYSIAESLDKHKKEMDTNTLFDYLVSTDGVVYRLYRDYVTMGQYMVALA